MVDLRRDVQNLEVAFLQILTLHVLDFIQNNNKIFNFH